MERIQRLATRTVKSMGRVAIRRAIYSFQCCFSQTMSFSLGPHSGLGHLPRSYRLASGGIFQGSHGIQSKNNIITVSFSLEESSLLSDASQLVKKSLRQNCQCPNAWHFQAFAGHCMAVYVHQPPLNTIGLQLAFCMV